MLQYPWQPHKTLYLRHLQPSSQYLGNLTFKTLSEGRAFAESLIQYYIDEQLVAQINDVIHLALQNSLKNTTDTDTKTFAATRIPSGVNSNNTTRFLIAFMYEKQLGFNELDIDHFVAEDFNSNPRTYSIHIPFIQRLYQRIEKWNQRANKIVEIMEDAASKVGSVLAGNADHIRDAALIELGEKTGLEISNGANRIGFSFGERRGGRPEGDLISYVLEANKSFFVERVESLRFAGRKANQTDTVTLTAKNGPTEITVTPISTGSVGKSVLAKDASRMMTNLELTSNVVSTQPIIVPTATRELSDITDLEVGESQSVNLANLFSGIRINITVASSDTNKVSINHVTNGATMSVTAVAVGTATITVTGTNEAGNISVTFDTTVIAASE